MSKLKCAYMYSTQDHPLPTRAKAEKMFGVRILYGLEGKKLPPLPYNRELQYVDEAFHTVFHMYQQSAELAPHSAKLVVFDDSIDEVFFSIAAIQNTITKFNLDGQIIHQMRDLDYTLARLDGEGRTIQALSGRLLSFQKLNVGDQIFFDQIPKFSNYLHEIDQEIQRMSDAYRSQLKALFSCGW